ncbi:dirigent protein 22-like, partial [Vigna umbellata]|uniref:dirigent protein 22-like n=1 Tax=Vigna umbellata TaxID=87088 RepID=UPI001F5F3200
HHHHQHGHPTAPHLFLLSFTVATIAEDTGYVGTVDPKSLGLNKRKTLSHFRLVTGQDVNKRLHANRINIIPAIPKYNTTTSFGSVTVTDNALTLGPELSSKVVGRSEGIYALTSQSQVTLLMVMNFVLTEGKYNGKQHNYRGGGTWLMMKKKKLPVVGGSGVFPVCHRLRSAKTYHFDPTTGDATTEYNIYVFHY